MEQNKPKIVFSSTDISENLNSVMGEKGAFQVMFNQGKIVYQTTLLAVDEKYLYFDFDGIEETSLMSMIDFYGSTLFVYYANSHRSQFMAKNALLTSMEGTTVLRIPYPSSINMVPSRKTKRFVLPDGFANVSIKTMDGMATLPLREISLGGLSIWSASSYSMTAHTILKNVTISFHDGFSVSCNIEISRVNYVAEGPNGMTHIISAQFIDLNEKQENLLARKFEQYQLSEAED